MTQLICRATGATFDAGEPIWRAGDDGLLDLEMTPQLDRATLSARPMTMWRYREALPIECDDHIVTLGEGCTPLVAETWARRPVWLKLEHLMPSGSYKDRGASLMVSKARELGVHAGVEDSSGNAGAAVAAYCATAGLACEIYAPASASRGKLLQIEAMGAALRAIEGTRDDVARACRAAAEFSYYLSHVWNPFFLHGVKTFAYEVVEQLGWRAPDVVVLPVGNGALLLGAFIGFQELRDLGVIATIPRLVGVQAENCAPLVEAWRARAADYAPFAARPTMAEGISIAEPRRGPQCLEAVRTTGGAFIAVDEAEILAAWRALCAMGYFVEPTSAATVAGITRLGDVPVDAVVVAPLTGHGLKAVDKLLKIAAP